MDRPAFWELIAATKAQSQGDCERQAELLREALEQRSPDEIIAFDRILRELQDEAYTWELWGAAYIINGGCSDDGFEYFRGWLIAQGEQMYTAAVRDPDSLAAAIEPDEDSEHFECESLLYVAMEAYEAQTGDELPAPPVPDREPTGLEAHKPRGQEWNEDDLPDLFPALAAKCGWMESESD